MDAFYAAVEVLDNPELRGKPVVVGGTPEGRGVVAAASYEARRYGIHSAMSAARARKLCPGLICRRGRFRRYGEVSEQIFGIFGDYTPLVEPLSIDEAFLDVTGCRRLFGEPEGIGRRIKERIRREVGLTASVGVAPNKFLAKVGSDLEKPDGFFVFTRENCREILERLPVGRLWGVGPATAERLRRLRVERIGDLLAIPQERLEGALGEHARRLTELARGEDERPVVPDHEAKSIGHEITFAADIDDCDELIDILDRLAGQVARRLRKHGRLARTVSVKARYPDFVTPSRARTLPHPTDATDEIRLAARELFLHRLGRGQRPLRLLGVSVANLVEPRTGQPELFADPDRARQKTIDRVMDRVQNRFGNDAVRRGTGRKRPT
jgi:DNA polymerase-4